MSLQQEIREDLDVEVFQEFGKSVTLIRQGEPTLNERGEIESTQDTRSNITAVPYNIIETRGSSQPFGELQEGDLDMAVRYDQSIDVGDKVIIEGVTYKVREVSKNFLPENVVTIVRLTRVPDSSELEENEE